jgi:predicted ribonuclease toxin of YeeF-YezG toxin-antitoxin module
LAELGIDTFEFAGSAARKILNLMNRVGFTLPIDNATFISILNSVFNTYTSYSRVEYQEKDFLSADTTKGKAEREVEAEVFHLGAAHAAAKVRAAPRRARSAA